MRALLRVICRFGNNRSGNIAVISALTMVPTIYLLGMALDYTQALRRQGQLNAAADAAAIAAVRPAMMLQTSTVAHDAAVDVFAATANTLAGALSSIPSPTINVIDSGLQRTATVSYNAQSINNFPVLLRSPAWPIGGSSQAQASTAPNLNFYLLVDDSPSMGIGASLDDINSLITATAPANQPARASQNCGFACHETNIGHDGGSKDNLAIARDNGITLRIDLVTDALNQLLNRWTGCPQSGVSGGVMQCMSTLNHTTYRAALYTFDVGLNTVQTLSTPATVGSKVNNTNIALMSVVYQNCVFSGCSSSSATNPNTDYGTDIAGALSRLNDIMPNPGLGSNATSDSPQEVVFLITDGFEDKISSSCPNGTFASHNRCQQPLDTTMCTTIKNRGIKIAVLYTEYLQLINLGPSQNITDNWYMSWVDAYDQPSSSTGTIAKNLEACASTGFYNHVKAGDSISDALTDLFIRVAASTANLTH